ncbi:MFS transporter [Rugosimonospora africana]|uniref:MFS transporter n=1 Tax=Rugosimonospora africana TaxID=556532 RepID=A0A8J3VUC0_9ACTN|nr:MFS transporter [Rugosimonospora africana]
MTVAVVVLAVFMTNLDLWIVNVALPAMGAGFAQGGHAPSLGALSWVLNAYAIALSALLVVAGRAADRIGQRQVFLAGVVVFTVASVACALAPNLPVLVIARIVQAVGAAAQLPSSLSLMLAVVPPARRTGATRGWAAVGGLAAAAGPVLGGLLVEIDWRWVFVVNLPIGIGTLIAGARVLPRPTAREAGPLPDLVGAVLITASVATLTGALVQAPDWGWTSARTLGLLAVAAVTGAWFTRRCLRHPTPLLELQLLRLPRFGIANTGMFVFSVAFAIMLLSNVLWCQDVWHWSALRTGLAMVPGPALVPIVTLLSARAARRLGHGPFIIIGGLLFAAGMAWRVGSVSVTPDYVRDLLPSMLLGGTGVGFALGTLIAAGVTSLPGHRSATGSALVNSGRQIASSVGVAVLVTLIGKQIDAGSIGAFRAGWAISACLSVACALTGVVLLRPGRQPSVPAPSPEVATESVSA